MSNRKRRQLDNIIAALQTRYGPQAVRKAGELKATKPPALSSGFPALDHCTRVPARFARKYTLRNKSLLLPKAK